MTNIPYLLGKSAAYQRKDAILAQEDLFNEKQVLLYQKTPLKLTVLQAFVHQVQIRAFFDKFIYTFEPLTRIEQAKIEEVKAYDTLIHQAIFQNIRLYSTIFAVWSLVRPDYEWFYVHKMSYLYRPSRQAVVRRLVQSSVSAGISFKAKAIATCFGMCFYYPEFLADLQIGEDFEIGYWSHHFVGSLVSSVN